MEENQERFYDLHDVSNALGLYNPTVRDLMRALENKLYEGRAREFYDGLFEVEEMLPEKLLLINIFDLDYDNFLSEIVGVANRIFSHLKKGVDENQREFHDLHDVSNALGLYNPTVREIVAALKKLMRKNKIYNSRVDFREVERLLSINFDNDFDELIDKIVEAANKVFHFHYWGLGEDDFD